MEAMKAGGPRDGRGWGEWKRKGRGTTDGTDPTDEDGFVEGDLERPSWHALNGWTTIRSGVCVRIGQAVDASLRNGKR